MDDVWKVAVPAVLGFLTGVLASVVAPWVAWRVESRKALSHARREFLKECRALIQTDPDREAFRHTALYAQLRPHLSERSIKTIESEDIVVTVGHGRNSGVNTFAPLVLDDIAKLEAEWGLL